MFWFIFGSLLVGVFGAEFTLLGECPNVSLQENFDYAKFSGVWYNTASYASDGRAIYDCATLTFQEDDAGYTLNETYVDKRSRKSYFARVDPSADAGNKAKFVVSHQDLDKVLQFPFQILSTDYEKYAIAYTCKTLKKRQRMHYVFAWILSRDKVQRNMQDVQNVLSRYTELAENRRSFVFKDFTEENCSYDYNYRSNMFTNNFW